MLRTIAFCSGKGGVGKTLLATCLARIIRREEDCNVLLVDLDVSVRGLTLLAFQNKYELDQVPISLIDYLLGGPNVEKELFQGLHEALTADGEEGRQNSPYRRLEKVFILPASTESERPDWTQFARIEFDHAMERLKQLQAFATASHDVGYIIFDTRAGLGSLSLAAATLSDVNLIVLEEDNISWRAALNMLLEITDLNKRLGRRSKNYFMANKVSVGFLEAAGKLKAFSFLPPILYDRWVQRLLARDTSAALEREFENTNFFHHVHSRVWKEITSVLGMTRSRSKDSFSFMAWWRKLVGEPGLPERRPVGKATSAHAHHSGAG